MILNFTIKKKLFKFPYSLYKMLIRELLVSDIVPRLTFLIKPVKPPFIFQTHACLNLEAVVYPSFIRYC